MDNPNVEPRIIGSRGTHLIFKSAMLPANSGFIVPKTNDGRLLFAINYLGHVMVGTTDEKSEITHNCEPTQEEIDFIIQEIKPYFPEGFDFKENLVSTFAGIRPLAKSSNHDYEPPSHDGMLSRGIKSFFTKFAALVNYSK